MIFQPAIVRAILRGEVTQTRRPVDARDPHYRQSRRLKSTPSRVLVQPFRPQEGDRYPVKASVRSETQAHVLVTSVEHSTAGTLTFDDARAMGYRTTSEAMEAWLAQHDQGWDPHGVKRRRLIGPVLPVCEACGGPGVHTDGSCVTCGTQDQAAARFLLRHTDKPVWVIRFELDTTHVPRLLAADPGLEQDYVTSPAVALPGEPEALTEIEHKRHVQDTADRTLTQWQKAERATRLAELEQLSLGRRLDQAISEAAAEGRSVTRQVRVIEQRLRELERGPLRRAA